VGLHEVADLQNCNVSAVIPKDISCLEISDETDHQQSEPTCTNCIAAHPVIIRRFALKSIERPKHKQLQPPRRNSCENSASIS